MRWCMKLWLWDGGIMCPGGFLLLWWCRCLCPGLLHRSGPYCLSNSDFTLLCSTEPPWTSPMPRATQPCTRPWWAGTRRWWRCCCRTGPCGTCATSGAAPPRTAPSPWVLHEPAHGTGHRTANKHSCSHNRLWQARLHSAGMWDIKTKMPVRCTACKWCLWPVKPVVFLK